MWESKLREDIGIFGFKKTKYERKWTERAHVDSSGTGNINSSIADLAIEKIREGMGAPSALRDRFES